MASASALLSNLRTAAEHFNPCQCTKNVQRLESMFPVETAEYKQVTAGLYNALFHEDFQALPSLIDQLEACYKPSWTVRFKAVWNTNLASLFA